MIINLKTASDVSLFIRKLSCIKKMYIIILNNYIPNEFVQSNNLLIFRLYNTEAMIYLCSFISTLTHFYNINK